MFVLKLLMLRTRVNGVRIRVNGVKSGVGVGVRIEVGVRAGVRVRVRAEIGVRVNWYSHL